MIPVSYDGYRGGFPPPKSAGFPDGPHRSLELSSDAMAQWNARREPLARISREALGVDQEVQASTPSVEQGVGAHTESADAGVGDHGWRTSDAESGLQSQNGFTTHRTQDSAVGDDEVGGRASVRDAAKDAAEAFRRIGAGTLHGLAKGLQAGARGVDLGVNWVGPPAMALGAAGGAAGAGIVGLGVGAAAGAAGMLAGAAHVVGALRGSSQAIDEEIAPAYLQDGHGAMEPYRTLSYVEKERQRYKDQRESTGRDVLRRPWE